MGEDEVRERLERALRRLLEADRHLLENDLSERCMAARLAMYLRDEFDEHDVDVEYNRAGDVAKRLRGLPDECYRRRNRQIEAPVAVPDVIVHHRGMDGPNLLVNRDEEDVQSRRHELRPFAPHGVPRAARLQFRSAGGVRDRVSERAGDRHRCVGRRVGLPRERIVTRMGRDSG